MSSAFPEDVPGLQNYILSTDVLGCSQWGIAGSTLRQGTEGTCNDLSLSFLIGLEPLPYHSMLMHGTTGHLELVPWHVKSCLHEYEWIHTSPFPCVRLRFVYS